jgi:hypothetical protein
MELEYEISVPLPKPNKRGKSGRSSNVAAATFVPVPFIVAQCCVIPFDSAFRKMNLDISPAFSVQCSTKTASRSLLKGCPLYEHAPPGMSVEHMKFDWRFTSASLLDVMDGARRSPTSLSGSVRRRLDLDDAAGEEFDDDISDAIGVSSRRPPRKSSKDPNDDDITPPPSALGSPKVSPVGAIADHSTSRIARSAGKRKTAGSDASSDADSEEPLHPTRAVVGDTPANLERSLLGTGLWAPGSRPPVLPKATLRKLFAAGYPDVKQLLPAHLLQMLPDSCDKLEKTMDAMPAISQYDVQVELRDSKQLHFFLFQIMAFSWSLRTLRSLAER